MVRIRIAVMAFAVLVASACQPLLFRQDHRVAILSPAIYSTVGEPLTITWVVKDFSAPADGKFAVFMDRDPMPPGESIDYFDPGNRDSIFVLSASRLRIDLLNPQVGVDPAEINHHMVTVVLLDRSGRRIGEEAGFTGSP